MSLRSELFGGIGCAPVAARRGMEGAHLAARLSCGGDSVLASGLTNRADSTKMSASSEVRIEIDIDLETEASESERCSSA